VWGNVITNISKGRGLRPRGRDGGSGKLVAPLSERERERLEKVMGGALGRLCPLWRGERGRKRERKKVRKGKERQGSLGMVWLVEHSGLRFWPELVCSTLLCFALPSLSLPLSFGASMCPQRRHLL
jgi:hypothetical protein